MIWIGEDGKISDMCCPLEELAEEEARPAVGLVIWYPEGEFMNISLCSLKIFFPDGAHKPVFPPCYRFLNFSI
jgi:hypothetical protein